MGEDPKKYLEDDFLRDFDFDFSKTISGTESSEEDDEDDGTISDRGEAEKRRTGRNQEHEYSTQMR